MEPMNENSEPRVLKVKEWLRRMNAAKHIASQGVVGNWIRNNKYPIEQHLVKNRIITAPSNMHQA